MNKTKKIEFKIAELKADFEAGKDLFQEYSKNLNLPCMICQTNGHYLGL